MVERYKNIKSVTFVHFISNGKIKIKSNPIKIFVVATHYDHQTRGENRLILAILNETFAFIK